MLFEKTHHRLFNITHCFHSISQMFYFLGTKVEEFSACVLLDACSNNLSNSLQLTGASTVSSLILLCNLGYIATIHNFFRTCAQRIHLLLELLCRPRHMEQMDPQRHRLHPDKIGADKTTRVVVFIEVVKIPGDSIMSFHVAILSLFF